MFVTELTGGAGESDGARMPMSPEVSERRRLSPDGSLSGSPLVILALLEQDLPRSRWWCLRPSSSSVRWRSRWGFRTLLLSPPVLRSHRGSPEPECGRSRWDREITLSSGLGKSRWGGLRPGVCSDSEGPRSLRGFPAQPSTSGFTALEHVRRKRRCDLDTPSCSCLSFFLFFVQPGGG